MKNKIFAILFILGLITFWVIRVYYWLVTKEVPFSDMANFDTVAHNIVTSGSFAWDNFWQSYTTPTLVTLRAIQIYITGDRLIYWQIFQGLITFFSLLWLAFELYQSTKKEFYSVVLIWIVALSRSSIFWSYKLAREGLAEGLIYLCAATTIWTFRQPKFISYFLTGIIYMITIFNRPNFIFLLPVFYLLILLNNYWKKRDLSFKLSKQFFAFTLGFLLIWTPWIIRNYSIYHEFLPLSTQGPYSFLWDLGNINDIEEGKTTNVKQLQSEAVVLYPNDKAASDHAQKIVNQWLCQNPFEYLSLIAVRINSSITNHQIDLTQVSRNDLLPSKIDDYLLLEKNNWLVVIGLIGLIVFVFNQRNLIIMAILVHGSWLTGLLFIGDPRILEPALPLIFFGSFYVIFTSFKLTFSWLKRYNTARPARA